jgi:ribosomal protein S18 acetylase RimI-like enzyme
MSDLLAAYDDSLRTEAEMLGALDVARIGPLWLGTFPGGQGFISYRDLAGADVEALVGLAVEHFDQNARVTGVEWKTRAHDDAPGLHEALVRRGFVPGEPESVMIGEAAALAIDLPLPDGVALRQITEDGDIRRMVAMQDDVFGSRTGAEKLLDQMAADTTIECWVAEVGGDVVSAGRLYPVPGTAFAGIWGGATRPQWRRQGIYRALTAARARSALRRGKKLIHSDSTDYSRPILQRYGFVKVTETMPYERHR